MSEIVNPSIFRFLRDLKNNNNRGWVAENKEYYQKEEIKLYGMITLVTEIPQM